MPVVFSKFSGGGNDFIIIDNRVPNRMNISEEEFVKRVCKRGQSIGADGVIFICRSETANFKWNFYNSDGSTADMCGNGARCAARFAYLNKIAPVHMTFETGAGLIDASIQDGYEVKVSLTETHSMKIDNELKVKNKKYQYSFINTGVPHAVIFFDDVSDVEVQNIGSAIRYHEDFAPAGTNVNFVQVTGKNSLKLRTYERGVEGETLACGTGSVASAVISIQKNLVNSPVGVTTSGGKIMTVFIENGKTYLQGEARLVFTGSLTDEAFNY